MKNKIILLVLTFSVCISNAQASNVYVGAEYQQNDLNISSKLEQYGVNSADIYSSQLSNINFVGGYKLDQAISVELNYFSDSQRKNNSIFATESNLELKNIGLNLVASLPFASNNFIKLTANAGINYIQANLIEKSDGDSESFDKNTTAENIGAGLSYDINNYITIRARINYMLYNNLSIGSLEIRDSVNYNIGLMYNF